MTTDEIDKTASSRPRRFRDFLLTMSKTTATRVRASLTGLISLRTFLILIIGTVLLHLFGLISIPFAPFTTTGKIYVDSPEVYTRERLVNDRYDQDYWLRQRLKKLDDPEALRLMVGEQVQAIKAGTGEASHSDESAKESDGFEGGNKSRHLSFEQEFRVASGVRDMIRQQILENMLDDRHDLTGNSVFGLKFDTTVIPGNNTRRRAFVHVALSSDDLFRSGDEKSDAPGNHIEGWRASVLNARKDSKNSSGDGELLPRFRKQQQYYLDWLTDVAKRLNRAENSVYEGMARDCPEEAGREFFDKLTGRTLEIVLGIPEERFWRLNGPQWEDHLGDGAAGSEVNAEPEDVWIRLPDPWANFFLIDRKHFELPDEKRGKSCKYRVWFEVNELTENYLFKRSVRSSGEQAGANGEQEDTDVELPCDEQEPIQLGSSEDEKWDIWVESCGYEFRKTTFDLAEVPRYRLTSDIIEKLLEIKKEYCDLRAEEGCDEEQLRKVGVQSGLFNFVEHMSERDAYSYAIFPKNDVVGVFTETSAQLSATAPMTGFLDLARRFRESGTASVLVGYGDGGGRSPVRKDEYVQGSPSIEFGWVISPRGDMEPTQKNQLALVSVPAWTDTLDLSVSVGWVDGRGNPEPDDGGSFPLHISVPPSLEVFDFIFREDARVTLGPSIRNSEIDEDIYVRTGQEAKILIPGSRLWRSATVTLGAQVAKRIRVLPNMEGIIAEFGRVEPPYAAYDFEKGSKQANDSPLSEESKKCLSKIKEIEVRDLLVRAVQLRVWTSEGVAKATRWVCVVYDPDEVLDKAPKSDDT